MGSLPRSKAWQKSSMTSHPPRPQRLSQPDQDIAPLRQVAQDQPGVDEIVASRWDRIGGDVVTGHLEMAQLGGWDEPGVTAGFGLSRSAVRGMVDSGRIRLPLAIDAKAREDFTLFVITTPPGGAGCPGI